MKLHWLLGSGHLIWVSLHCNDELYFYFFICYPLVVRSPERLPLPFPVTDYSCARVRDNMNGKMTQVSETIKEKQMNVDALATAYTLHYQTILNLVQHQIWLRHPRNVDVTVNDQGEQFTIQNKLSHPLHKHTTCFNTLRLKTHYL